MNSKEALESIGMTKTNNIKSESLSKPRVMYLVKELRKKEIQTIKQDLDKLEKLKKVIEILKEKIIDMSKILNSKNVEEYNNYVVCGFDFFDILTQEEYYLLKEVLGNE